MSLSGLVEDLSSIASYVGSYVPGLKPKAIEVEKVIIREVEAMRPLAFVRVAGLSGALAVAMGAYGAHGFRNSEADPHLKEVFDTGYRLHLTHSVALLASPITRRPLMVGTLLTTGMILFSGSCYYYSLTGNAKVRWITPYGGMCLIFGWLAMVL